ncbi:MAG: TIGR02757 family protein [Proteobacteria bacterium]|nr:TIGR02757 family protein [Pseudomonadota bacterium]
MILKDRLECLYSTYNKKEYVDPDPLIFLYDYSDKKNREIAGFIAACFAYGRVEMIMKTVAHILGKLEPSPFEYLMGRTKKDMANDFKGFRYRFASEAHLTNLLWGIREVLNRFISLENCFYAGWTPSDETVLPGLAFFFDQMGRGRGVGHLFADPQKKSACKRSHLFLRWMVRKDRVDPGGWDDISPSQLIIPLDTHMYRTGCMLEFTKRKNMDLKTALEITQGFRKILRQDPVKYDFCLTRFGIRKGLSMDELRTVVCT